MTNFWTLLKESVIMQALLTLILVGATVYLIIVNREVPTILAESTLFVIGYFFGSKTGVAQGRYAQKVETEQDKVAAENATSDK